MFVGHGKLSNPSLEYMKEPKLHKTQDWSTKQVRHIEWWTLALKTALEKAFHIYLAILIILSSSRFMVI